MKWLRVFLVLAAFQMEVRVKAHMSPESLSEPEGCLSGTGECHVKTGTAVLQLKRGGGVLTVASGTILERKDETWKLLQGALRAKNADAVSVYGVLKPSSEAWLIDDGSGRLTVRAVAGASRFVLRDGREIEVPEGFEVWIGGLGAGKRNLHGVPSPIPVEDHLKRLAAMDRLSGDDLRAEMKALKTRWQDRHEAAAALYDGIAKRGLASAEESERKERARRQAQDDEKKKYRQMLYDRAFGR